MGFLREFGNNFDRVQDIIDRAVHKKAIKRGDILYNPASSLIGMSTGLLGLAIPALIMTIKDRKKVKS